jgi:hypothetical protein
MTVVVVVLVVVGVVAIIGAMEVTMVRGYHRSMWQQTHRVVHPDLLGPLVESFVAGARWPWANASLLLVRLDFHEHGVRVHGSTRVLGWVLPDWQATYRDIVRSEHVVMRMSAADGLRLRTAQPNGWVIFWTTSSVEGLLARLASVGVPTSSATQRIGFLSGSNV